MDRDLEKKGKRNCGIERKRGEAAKVKEESKGAIFHFLSFPPPSTSYSPQLHLFSLPISLHNSLCEGE